MKQIFRYILKNRNLKSLKEKYNSINSETHIYITPELVY